MSIPRPPFWSRPRGPLLLGAAGCAACCSAPLAATLIGAGAASAIAGVAEPLAGVLLAAGAVLGFGRYLRGQRARTAACSTPAVDPASASACATDGSCGCGPGASVDRTLYSSPEPIAAAPVACTFDLSHRGAVHDHIDGYRAVFLHLASSNRTARGFTWRFRRAPGIEPRLRELAEREHGCCSFLKLDVSVSSDEVVWQARADSHAQGFLDELFRLPERLREEPHAERAIEHLKRVSEPAGLAFTAEPPR